MMDLLALSGNLVMEKESITNAEDDWDNSRELLETVPDR